MDFFRRFVQAVVGGIADAVRLVGSAVVAIIDGAADAARVLGQGLADLANATFQGLGVGAPLVLPVFLVVAVLVAYLSFEVAKFAGERVIERF